MPSILIVDDDPLQCGLAHRFLEQIPTLNVRYAFNGQDAMAQVASRPIDLVITDLRMPGMNGLELVKSLQEDYPSLPVILMTAYGSENLAVQALSAGAASYVPKACLSGRLVDTVLKVLSLSQARREREMIFRNMSAREIRFEIENNPEMIPVVVGYFQDSLRQRGFGNESVRAHVGFALMEALSNAMIHGNLEISSSIRRESQSKYFELVESRRKQEPYKSRKLRVRCSETQGSIIFTVADEGPGFNPRELPDPTDPQNMLLPSGRGLMLMRTFMDLIEYNENGTEVRMTKHVS
jgi:DNA-binding NarL/FixJ family response regulator